VLVAEQLEGDRTRLRAVAYRMLGSLGGADEAGRRPGFASAAGTLVGSRI
jgi:hypothetical protein